MVVEGTECNAREVIFPFSAAHDEGEGRLMGPGEGNVSLVL